jgi:hypothetical protein
VLAAAAGATVFVLGRYGAFDPSLDSQLAKIRGHAGPPAYYLGSSFAGLPLTHAEPPSGARVADFGYGRCHRFGPRLNPFVDHRCGYLLYVQVRELDPTPAAVTVDLDGAPCDRTHVGAAPTIVWHKHTNGGEFAGIYVLTDGATASLGNSVTLNEIDVSRLHRIAKALRSADGKPLPKADTDPARLLAHCKKLNG